MSIFNEVTNDPPIEVFEITKSFNEDKNSNKVNLGVGGMFLFGFSLNSILNLFFIKHIRMKIANHGYYQLLELLNNNWRLI
jgi:aspartate/tyrosine/aromatic aminotransferase